MCRSASGSRLSSTQRCAQPHRDHDQRHVDPEDERQENISISTPPPAGPITVAIPVQAVQVPTARPARLALEGRGEDRQRARDEQRAGEPLEPPAAIRTPLLGASAQRTEVTPKRPSPMMKIRRRAELVAERAADQQQRDQRQEVGLDDPLLAGEPDVRGPR